MTAREMITRKHAFGGLWENRTLIFAAVGLVIVIWLNFRERSVPAPTISGYTQAEMDNAKAKAAAAATKPIQDKLDQANKEDMALQQKIKQLTEALAKSRTSSDGASVSVDKLPTSLTVLLKGHDFDVIGETRNVVTTATLITYGERRNLLTTQAFPKLSILVIFKKPIAFTEDHIDSHGGGIPQPELTYKNPHFAVLTFDSIFYSGLIDIMFK